MSCDIEKKFTEAIEAYNKLEELFKVSQMVQHTFYIPVLNEYRYLSRALIDFYTPSSEDKDSKEKALSKFQVAIAAAYNDIIDSILIAIKFAIDDYYRSYPFVNAHEVLEKHNIKNVKDAILKATETITTSRSKRNSRFEQYEEFSKSNEYKDLLNFGLSLHIIEYELNMLNNRSNISQDDELFDIINLAFKNFYNNSDDYPKFELEFQPKCDLEKSIKGAEALIRLYRDEKTKIPPLSFLYIIQNAKKHKELDLLVLQKTVSAIKQLENNNSLPDGFDVAVNVMPKTITQDYTYIETFNELINEYLLEKHLSLEIVESWDSENGEHIKVHYRLAQLINNTKIAIDDFGTGSTKLEYVAMIDNLHSIKIDKSIIDALLTNNNDKALNLIKGIVSLANQTNLKVVIEGVEKEKQFNMLKELDINLYQGYYFHKPMSLTKLSGLLTK